MKMFGFQVQDLKLEELFLQGCKELTDYSVEILVKHQPGLLQLDISECMELTSRSVEAVARGLKSLSHLSLSHDWRITEKGKTGFDLYCFVRHVSSLVTAEKKKSLQTCPTLPPCGGTFRGVAVYFTFLRFLYVSNILSHLKIIFLNMSR